MCDDGSERRQGHYRHAALCPDKEGAAEETGDVGLAQGQRRGQEGTGGRVATPVLLGGATGQSAYHGEEVAVN